MSAPVVDYLTRDEHISVTVGKTTHHGPPTTPTHTHTQCVLCGYCRQVLHHVSLLLQSCFFLSRFFRYVLCLQPLINCHVGSSWCHTSSSALSSSSSAKSRPSYQQAVVSFLNKLCMHCLNGTLYECFIVGKQSIAGRKLYTKYDVLLAILFLIVQCIMILIIVF